MKVKNICFLFTKINFKLFLLLFIKNHMEKIMTQQDLWNKKFSRSGYLYGKEPNLFIKSCEKLFPTQKLFLCLGEGEGRNAIYFAKKGFLVEAIDASNIAIDKLEKYAKEEETAIFTQCLDLNEWQPKQQYGSIIASYLHIYENEREKLFTKIEKALECGGYFIGEFFSTKQLEFTSGGPKDLSLLYTIEDFENAFESCIKHKISEELVMLNEGNGHQGEACVIRVIIQKN